MIRKKGVCLKIKLKTNFIKTFSKSNKEPTANVANKIISLALSFSNENNKTISILKNRNERSILPFVL